MKKYFLLFNAILIFNLVHGQTSPSSTTVKKETVALDVTGSIPVEKSTGVADQRTTRKKLSISKEPIPKADPAREAFAKRKEQKTFTAIKTN